MDIKVLKEELRKKKGFLYRIQTEDDELFYAIGCGIFKQYNSRICDFRDELDKALNNGDEELQCRYFKKILHSPQLIKVEGEEYINQCKEYNEFIDSLNANQIKSLSEQLELYIKLFRKFKLNK